MGSEEVEYLYQARELLNIIAGDHRSAIASVETLKKIAYDEDYLGRFVDTYSGHVVRHLQNVLVSDAVLAINRMWDGGKNIRSIPALLKLLEGNSLQCAIKSERVDTGWPEARIYDADKKSDEELKEIYRIIKADEIKRGEERAASVVREIKELNDLCEDSEFSDLRAKLRVMRTEVLAHNIGSRSSDRENYKIKTGVDIEPVKWGELEQAVVYGNQAIQRLSLLVRDASYGPEDFQEIWEGYADAFWDSIPEGPK